MIKILTVIGARPQIIKAAALSHTIHEQFSGRIEEKILHTGQHYDTNMSQVFFDELGIPAPDYNLGVGSGPHGRQTAMMIEGIENVLLSETFDGIMLYGDTNSTLAGAVAASKLDVPIFHIEAGLRSYDMSMPEEVNRIVCDQLSTLLFAPTRTAVNNLEKEGFGVLYPMFSGGRSRRVCLSGDVMYDNALHFASLAERSSDILRKYHLEHRNFVLATIHRPVNTDDPRRLNSIFRALLDISSQEHIPIVLPLHPRTSKLLERNLEDALYAGIMKSPSFCLIPPVSFLDILMLEKNARTVVTDSGGVQKESFFFGTPTVILRSETEWVEIVEYGAGILAGAEEESIIRAYRNLSGQIIHFPPLFGDGHAAEVICREICNN